jgi:peptidoglycan/xylan/chitin deacetylase (PgdA/CDA1 family)
LFALIFLVVCVTDVAYAQRRYPTRADFPAGTQFIAITFDDGPNNKYTVEILNILGQHNARGTFFVNPQKFDNPTLWHPSGGSDGRGGGGLHTNTLSVIRRMIAEGHDVENHTFDHQSMGGAQNYSVPPAATSAQARTSLQRASREIFEVTGYWPWSFRAPFFEWGNILMGLDRELDMVFVDSALDPADFNKQGSGGRNEIANWVLNQSDAHLNGGIVLLHDCGGSRPETAGAVGIMVPALKARGFEIVTVRELAMIAEQTPCLFTGSNMWPRVNQWFPHRRPAYQHENRQVIWPNQPRWWENMERYRNPTPPWNR